MSFHIHSYSRILLIVTVVIVMLGAQSSFFSTKFMEYFGGMRGFVLDATTSHQN